MMVNGPFLSDVIFLFSCLSLKFFDSSHTLLLTLKGVKPLVVLLIVFCLANS